MQAMIVPCVKKTWPWELTQKNLEEQAAEK